MCDDFYDDFDGDWDGDPEDYAENGLAEDGFEGTDPEFDAESEWVEPSCLDGISWCEMGLFLALSEQITREKRERGRILRESEKDPKS